jgi:peptidoglycan-associated lipoprotein
MLLLAISAVACRKNPDVDPTPTEVQAPVSPPTAGTPITPPATPGVDTVAARIAIEGTKASLAAPVYFDYDIGELSADARSNLDTKVQILRLNSSVRVRIEGHCDNRGSDEYNIALGQRRAAAARAYMESRGIPASRFETVSLGEEKPAMMGESESAWAKNRRDEFVIIAGAITTPIGD